MVTIRYSDRIRYQWRAHKTALLPALVTSREPNRPAFNGAGLVVTNVYCVCVGYRRDNPMAASDMTEGPRDGAASEEDRRRKQPPRLRLSRHAEPGGGQVESVGDLHSQRQAGVSSAVLG